MDWKAQVEAWLKTVQSFDLAVLASVCMAFGGFLFFDSRFVWVITKLLGVLLLGAGVFFTLYFLRPDDNDDEPVY